MAGYIASIADKPAHQRRKDAWKAMKSFWERTDPNLIDAEMCRTYAKQREHTAGETTIRYELLQISTALKWGRRQKHTVVTPDMWFPPKAARKVRHINHDEFERFFAELKLPHSRLYVLLGLYTMARPASILDLTWDRIDFERRLIDFNKPGRRLTSKRRPVVPIHDELHAALKEAYAGRQSNFVVEYAGGQVGSVKKFFQRASERSGVKVTPYTLRHTGAVWAAEAGVPMSQLAQFMGHDDDRTTQQHYARYSPGFLSGVANAVQRKPQGT